MSGVWLDVVLRNIDVACSVWSHELLLLLRIVECSDKMSDLEHALYKSGPLDRHMPPLQRGELYSPNPRPPSRRFLVITLIVMFLVLIIVLIQFYWCLYCLNRGFIRAFSCEWWCSFPSFNDRRSFTSSVWSCGTKGWAFWWVASRLFLFQFQFYPSQHFFLFFLILFFIMRWHLHFIPFLIPTSNFNMMALNGERLQHLHSNVFTERLCVL